MTTTPTPPPVPKPRNLFLRVLIGFGIGLGLIVVVAVLALTFFRYRQEQRIAVELAAIRAAGYPVTWEELDRWYTKPASNDCTALYTHAFALLPSKYDEPMLHLPFFFDFFDPKKEEKLVPGVSLSAKMKEAIRSCLTTNEASLALLRQVMGVPACRYPVDLSQGLAAPLPQVTKARTGVKMLALEAVLRAEEGETQEATESLLAGAALANSFQREPILISRLVLLACHGINLTALEWCLSRTAFADEQLAILSKTLHESEDLAGMEHTMAGERAMTLGMFEQLRTGKMQFDELDMLSIMDESGKSDAEYVSLIWKLPCFGVFGLDMLFCIGVENDYVVVAQLPLEKRCLAAKSVEERVEKARPRYGFLSSLFLPGGARAIEMDVRGLTRLRVAETALAVERYRLKNGKLPGGLGELVPEYLEKTPVDPFDGKELRYVIREKGFTVYSVGPDGADNGGVKLDKDGREFQPGTDVTFSVAR